MILISLILATFGRAETIAQLVQSLMVQEYSAFELIVVDQNPDDRVVPYLNSARECGILIKHIRMEKPNLSAARNLGIRHSEGAIVAFPDDDCWYQPDTLREVLTAFARHTQWQGVVAQWVEQVAAEVGQDQAEVLVEADWRNFRGGNASSITLFLKRSLFDSLGGFDERLGVGQWFGAGEETDLILRTLRLGALVGRWRGAQVHHPYAARASDKSRQIVQAGSRCLA